MRALPLPVGGFTGNGCTRGPSRAETRPGGASVRGACPGSLRPGAGVQEGLGGPSYLPGALLVFSGTHYVPQEASPPRLTLRGATASAH